MTLAEVRSLTWFLFESSRFLYFWLIAFKSTVRLLIVALLVSSCACITASFDCNWPNSCSRSLLLLDCCFSCASFFSSNHDSSEDRHERSWKVKYIVWTILFSKCFKLWIELSWYWMILLIKIVVLINLIFEIDGHVSVIFLSSIQGRLNTNVKSNQIQIMK